MTPPLTIDVRALRREYGPFVAVRDVTFGVQRGEIFGYLGANGAGKSTTIRMLCGLIRPTGGSARVAGHDVARFPERVKSHIGYMSQKFSLYLDIPARHNLAFFAGVYGLYGRRRERAMADALDKVGLARDIDEITGALPGGLRQRLALACAVLHGPSVLFLDEPTAGVDPASRRQFWRLIRRLAAGGTTIFVTTHYMDEAEYCHRVGLMVDGSLVALDTPAALKRTYVPGAVVSFRGEGLLHILDRARALPFVLAAEPFGDRLHVRFDPSETDPGTVERALRALGAEPSASAPVTATLEDVFLGVVGRTQRQRTTALEAP